MAKFCVKCGEPLTEGTKAVSGVILIIGLIADNVMMFKVSFISGIVISVISVLGRADPCYERISDSIPGSGRCHTMDHCHGGLHHQYQRSPFLE